MKFVYTLALIAFSLRLAAQTNVPVLSPGVSGDNKLLYAHKVEKYKRMKTSGALLIIGGGILAIAAVSTLSNVQYQTNPYTGQRTTNDPKYVSGILMLIGSEACLGAGIPLAIIGSKQSKRWQRKLDGVTLNFKLSPKQQGLALVYKF